MTSLPAPCKSLLLRTAATFALLSAALPALAQQPAQPVDPTPQNGETYYLLNQLSGLQADLNAGSTTAGAGLIQNTLSLVTLSQRWAFTKLTDGNWKISNIADGLCLDTNSTTSPVTAVQQPCAVKTTQEWSFAYTTNGYNTITNASSGLLLDTASASTAAALTQTAAASAPTQSQLWLFRPAFYRGTDNALLAKQEADRLVVSTPFFNDAGTVQDPLLILKNHGFNMVRVRPAPLTVPGTSTPLYTTYTLGSSSTSIPATCTGHGCDAETDAADIAVAKRAKQLGMSVELSVFFDGASSNAAPGAWAGYTATQTAAAVYAYVKAQVEEYRAAGVMPDVVSIGNEVDTGFLGSGLASGASGSPQGAYNSTQFTNFANYQKQGMQAVLDAASDTSIGAAVPPPLRCIHTTPAFPINTFFPEANQAGIPYELVCQSYYPIYHGALTAAQASSCSSPKTTTPEQTMLTNGAAAVNKPILMIEIGERYETGESSNDCFYPNNRIGQRQFALDMQSTVKALPGNLAAGLTWWDSTGTNVPLANGQYANYNASGIPYDLFYWDGLTLFDDADNGSYADNFAAPTYNTVLPAMTAVGGKLDPTLAYKLVNVANGRILETSTPTGGAGTALDTAIDTGLTGMQQQWQINGNGDGFFQIANLNSGSGTPNVLDNGASTSAGSAVAQQQAAGTPTAQQEWDVVTASNGTFTIVNRASGLVLAADTTQSVAGTITQQAASATNADWNTPASSAQQWRIIPVHISIAASAAAPAVLTVTAQNLSRAYATANPTLTYAITGFVNGDTQSVVSGTPVLSTTATSTSTVGSYPVTISIGTLSAANYTFTFVNGSLAVTPAATAVAFLPSPAKGYGGKPLGTGVLNATSTTAGTITYTAALGSGTAQPVTSTSALIAGTYTLTATLTPADATDYTASSTSVTFLVVPQNVWLTDSLGGLSEFNDGGTAASSQAYSGGSKGIAFDNAGSIWSLTSTGLMKTSPTGSSLFTASGTAGLFAPSALAIDGLGQVWIANSNGSLSVFTNAGSPVTPASGYTDSSLSASTGILIDSSGNVWVANSGNNSVTEILGAANPVAPLATGIANTSLGARP